MVVSLLTSHTARKLSKRSPEDPISLTVSNGNIDHSMADDTARMSGSHEVEDQLMKMTQPTEIRPNKLRGGDGLTNGHSHHMESQSDFRSTHRRLSLAGYPSGPPADSNPFFRFRAPYKHNVLF